MMSFISANIFDFTLWATIIEFAGALLIVGYMITALVALVRKHSVWQTQFIVADGIITGLGFKLAGTLLKTLGLHTWQQILMFAVIFALRTLIKRALTWERAQLERLSASRGQ
jgi:hypothetical protein